MAEVAHPAAPPMMPVMPMMPMMPVVAPIAEAAPLPPVAVTVAAVTPIPAPPAVEPVPSAPAAPNGAAHPNNGTPTAPVAESSANGGLTRRVKGAQMVDTGPDTPEATPASQRSADDVRAALSSFQQGTTLAATEVSHNHGKQ
jgi:hypothetical protein